jgi:phytoene dehydrogenase-like protein
MSESFDAVVVGSGPNGLAAALTVARAGRSVLVIEGAEEPGGGCRTAALTLPGYRHDLCSAIHPMAAASPFFRELPLADHGLEWVESPAAVAHPLDDAPAVLLERSVEETASALGPDGATYQALFAPWVEAWPRLERALLGPLRLPGPTALALLARFGVLALRSAGGLARRFRDPRSRALLAGLAGHSVLPLERAASAAVALVLGVAGHRGGWPLPRGGAGRITGALVGYLQALGGEVRCGHWVRSLAELPRSKVVLLDLTPRQVLSLAGAALPSGYKRRLSRFRYGPGVFKLDLAIEAAIPWSDPRCERAATVHLGGSFEEIAAAERAVWAGKHPERPFVLLAQAGLFDSSRAPRGRQAVWAYCHVPHGSTRDCGSEIELQIERFAPGFRDRILARHASTTADLEARNPNLVGGDLAGGVTDLRQMLARPIAGPTPYATPVAGLYLCSSSTPPGGGVHGMCGYHAAKLALRRELA